VGGAYLESQVNASATGAVVVAPGTSLNPDSNDWSWKLGLGAQYDFTRTVGVRGEWERYFDAGSSNTAKGDIDLFSLNLIFKF
jgi:opacity protein-like surface antigen